MQSCILKLDANGKISILVSDKMPAWIRTFTSSTFTRSAKQMAQNHFYEGSRTAV